MSSVNICYWFKQVFQLLHVHLHAQDSGIISVSMAQNASVRGPPLFSVPEYVLHLQYVMSAAHSLHACQDPNQQPYFGPTSQKSPYGETSCTQDLQPPKPKTPTPTLAPHCNPGSYRSQTSSPLPEPKTLNTRHRILEITNLTNLSTCPQASGPTSLTSG